MAPNQSKTSKKVSKKEKDGDFTPTDPSNPKRGYKRLTPQVIIKLTSEKRTALWIGVGTRLFGGQSMQDPENQPLHRQEASAIGKGEETAGGNQNRRGICQRRNRLRRPFPHRFLSDQWASSPLFLVTLTPVHGALPLAPYNLICILFDISPKFYILPFW